MSTISQSDTDVSEEEEEEEDVEEKLLGDQLDDLDLDQAAEDYLTSVVEEVHEARENAEDAYTMVRDTRKRLRRAIDRIETLEEENQRLREQVADLDNRTSLLQTASTQNRNVVEQRAGTLLQTLFNQAWKDKQKDNSKVKPKASMDHTQANYALGGDLAREQLYAAMKRAVVLVHPNVNEKNDDELADDENHVRFIKEPRSSQKNTRLLVDLTEVDRLETTLGKTITPPSEN